jgi:cellulose synthase/poly-beta-1,6-N-acetylglucosamine synthase-like glycosyltransferase
VAEVATVRDRLGTTGVRRVAQALAEVFESSAAVHLLRMDTDLRCHLLVARGRDARTTADSLEQLVREIATLSFDVRGERIRLTPFIGYEEFDRVEDGHTLLRNAETAADVAGDRLDLVAVSYESVSDALAAGTAEPHKDRSRSTTPWQVALACLLGLGMPYAAYTLLGRFGIDITGTLYLLVAAALVLTAMTIWVEGLLALDPATPPRRPATPYPPMTAVIAAYLPNEAATIVDTVEAFLALDYPAPMQVILAYNTPRQLPVENILHEIARGDPRLTLLRVENSTSKAQNVNAAVSEVTGEFVGIFDADHHPQQGSFQRAWHWLSHGYGIVQGHCVIRNGDASRVARMVAVEFESIYAISHPGRARLHGFGIFGGSNGYWSTELLRKVRLRNDMLTEDIDSAIRTLENGARIASDPGLISRELAPTNLTALTNQRLRWAQGWFQVCLRRLGPALRSRHLTRRQKAGMAFLLGWREIYPWVSMQVWPLVAYRLTHPLPGHHALTVPLFLAATLLTMAVGPAQTFFAYTRSSDDLHRHPRWFWVYALGTALLYTEFKNMLVRVAHLKEISGERQWKITPRGNAPAVGLPSGTAP